MGHEHESLLSRPEGVKLEVGRAISDGWAMFKAHPLQYVLFGLMVIFITQTPSIIAQVLTAVAGPNEISVIIGYVNPVYTLMMFPLYFGFFLAATRHLRGEHFSCGAMFHGFYFFFPLLLLVILMEILIIIGLFLCIIPGLYLAFTLGFSPLVYMEYPELGIFGALTTSRRVAHHSFWQIVLLWICFIGITLLGLLCLGVGVFVAYPVTALATAAAFEQMFGLSANHQPVVGCVFTC